jgi:signal transduction histidine kinase
MKPTIVDSRRASNARIRIKSAFSSLADLGQAAAHQLEPAKFKDPAAEAGFLNEFRMAGLPLTANACCIAIAGYVLIAAADIVSNGWSSVEAARRILPVMLLGLIVGLVALRPPAFLRRYNGVLGTLGLLAYGLSVSMTHLYREDDPTTVVNPTALIGLWIIYGFVRLPLRITVFLCAVGGALALLGSRVTNMPDPMTRTLIYLLVANALGIILSRSIEIRERQLFQQRRILESAQSELQRRSSTAEEASAEKSRLVAAIGHDLRQPMMAAVLHLSVLIGRVRARDVTGVERQADRVHDAVLFLRDSLEHLLLSARYDAGVEEVRSRPVALKEVFQKLSDLCESRGSPERVKLTIDVPDRKVIVSTDPQILLRALVNLVDNALKYSRGSADVQSRVVIRAVVRNGECRIAVVDNGIGIAGSDVESIWQPFSQVGSSETSG